MSMSLEPILIAPHQRVVVLTGAGISAESGLRTFRDSNGLWESHRIEEVASPEGWDADRALVWKFYSARREQARKCDPNAAHRALADVQRQLEGRLTLVTQNVDDLHERSGSVGVIHMHGELVKSRCDNDGCSIGPFIDERLYFSRDEIARCECGGYIRPHIVWFGEYPFEMHRIQRALHACHWFVVIGTSGSVYPAAGFASVIAQRRAEGAVVRSVYVGPEEPENAAKFDEIRIGPACAVVPHLFQIAKP